VSAAEEEEQEDAVGPEDDVEMGFFEHLAELRKRLMRALLGVLPAVVVAWMYKEALLEWMLDPLVSAQTALELSHEIHFTSLTEPFVAYLKIAIVVGLLGASPWVFWQMWAFIAPGLYRKEKLMAIPFVIASTGFFTGGAVFGYEIIFPFAFQTFLEYAGTLPSGDIVVTDMITLGSYLTLSTRMLLAFGVVFEVPVVVTALSAAGIVTAKGLWRFGRWWVLVSTFLAAFLTPPDVASQLMVLGPLVILYYMSCGIAFLIDWRRSKKDDEANDEGYER